MSRMLRRRVDGILLLDKPEGLSSNTALQMVRRLYDAEKAGHTGSLDPLATGLLPVCLGQATKLCGYLLDAGKRYRARVRLGIRTSSGDAEGAPIAHSDPSGLTRAQLEAVVPRFLGWINQVPPMYSALKRDGTPLYVLARAGVEVERAARSVRIDELRLLDFGGDHFEFEVACSKGTYVRTLAEDWAAAAGQQAHLSALRRIGLHPFDHSAMVPLEQLQSSDTPSLDALLLPLSAALAGWPEVTANAVDSRRLAHGQAIAGGAQPGLVAVYDEDRRLLCIAEGDGCDQLSPRRWLQA